MVPYPIKESYSWISPEFTYNDAPGNKVIIRGPALFSVEKHFTKGVSGNVRRYVQDEIMRSARTLKGKYIDVNHEFSTWKNAGETGIKPTLKGHVIFGEEENGTIEYVAEVNNREYAQKIRDTDKVRKGKLTEEEYHSKWGKYPLAGVSVDADFYHYKCPHCGEKFYTSETYADHMHNVEKVKNFQWEPHQIIFNGLSIVEPPEIPGVKGATFEIVETQNGLSQLLETVIKTGKEKETMTNKTKVPYKIREQQEKDEDEKKKKQEDDVTEQDDHGCGEGEEWDGEKCVPKATEQVEDNAEGDTEPLACPTGYHLVTNDAGEQSCEPDLPPPPVDNPVAEAVDVQPMEMPVAGDGATVTPTEQTQACPTGQHRDPATGLCVADDTVVEPAPNTMETVKLPTLLRLGEPFAGYSSMDDCIAKNPDKDNPSAFCASIMHKAEGEPASEVKESKDIYETQQNISKRLTEIDSSGMVRDARIAESVNKLNRSLAETIKQIQQVNNSTVKPMKEIAAQIFAHVKNVEKAANFNLISETKKQRKATLKEVNRLVNQSNTIVEAFNKHVLYTHKQLTEQGNTYNQLREYVTAELGKLSTSIAETDKRIMPPDPQLLQEIQSLKELVRHVEEVATEQKTDFEKILKVADTNYTNVKEQLKTLEQWKQEKETEIKETKKQEEQKNALTEALEPIIVKVDNLETKLKGEFKQKNKTVEPETPEETDLKQDKLPYD